MTNDTTSNPLPTPKPCTPQQAPTQPMPPPCKPATFPNPMHHDKSSVAVDKLALEREAPHPTDRAATPPAPPVPDSGVKRCLAIAASGKRCRREARNFKN